MYLKSKGEIMSYRGGVFNILVRVWEVGVREGILEEAILSWNLKEE